MNRKITFVLVSLVSLALVLLVLFLVGGSLVNAQADSAAPSSSPSIVTDPPFTEISTTLPTVYGGFVAWGDYDNDGDLDILLTGSTTSPNISTTPITKIYRNDGAGIFTDIDAALVGVYSGSAAWGDFDNDGDLDILLTGYIGNISTTRIYRNDGGGVFADINAGLTTVSGSSVAWGDYDNDGDLDILLTGHPASGYIAKVYRNDGGGVFTNISAGLPGVSEPSVAWGDYDNDDDLDILLAGYDPPIDIAMVYRNDGGGVFTNISAGLTGVSKPSVAWGDYDNDGDLDILLAGLTGTYPDYIYVAQVYRNDGGVFTDIGAGLAGVSSPSVAWGDYDNDGDLDILLTGYTGSTRIARIYRNDGGGAFADISAGLTGVIAASVAWGDYDNDNDLDILIMGYSDSSPVTKLYQNNATIPNTVPSVPAGLVASVVNGTAAFSWNPTSDAQTPVNGLTYNLRVGTTPGGSDIASPMAAGNGYRRVPQLGNLNHGLTATLHLIPRAYPYYWSVQAIDTAWAGSPFAAEGSLMVSGPAPQEVIVNGPTTGIVNRVYTFTAAVNPVTATLPITYIWEASGQATVIHRVFDWSDVVTFAWPAPGDQIITVTVHNVEGTTSNTYHFQTI